MLSQWWRPRAAALRRDRVRLSLLAASAPADPGVLQSADSRLAWSLREEQRRLLPVLVLLSTEPLLLQPDQLVRLLVSSWPYMPSLGQTLAALDRRRAQLQHGGDAAAAATAAAAAAAQAAGQTAAAAAAAQ
ncbi:hypothetical protein MNEG_5536 [Monoraphidium neglectum]|jgi:hypothetical protein|uniref:Uncharacterized protein n=1 Tax=Monoraphidium neglectum TaxID=145388 RepID=A0A0D2MH64_9CHLO|nr:hypothetical protein MNEG_5536 [Monoraphidium neglectum]KIZ02425.1 hypothetical protein MNEG_5536 [Monoraphidium neglectum]|eukprot:XP_013901444.1 hypothetical protein MNEG_5536 [Monoraphidium neglectum]